MTEYNPVYPTPTREWMIETVHVIFSIKMRRNTDAETDAKVADAILDTPALVERLLSAAHIKDSGKRTSAVHTIVIDAFQLVRSTLTNEQILSVQMNPIMVELMDEATHQEINDLYAVAVGDGDPDEANLAIDKVLTLTNGYDYRPAFKKLKRQKE